jgi:hypothetical protein
LFDVRAVVEGFHGVGPLAGLEGVMSSYGRQGAPWNR